MSILSDVNTIITGLSIPVETGIFTDKAPESYAVVLPLSDVFDLHCDNRPEVDVQEARISLYSQGSYTGMKNSVIHALIEAGITITARQYLGYEPDTGYHHYNIDASQYYPV